MLDDSFAEFIAVAYSICVLLLLLLLLLLDADVVHCAGEGKWTGFMDGFDGKV
jgi:hypothetical protein